MSTLVNSSKTNAATVAPSSDGAFSLAIERKRLIGGYEQATGYFSRQEMLELIRLMEDELGKTSLAQKVADTMFTRFREYLPPIELSKIDVAVDETKIRFMVQDSEWCNHFVFEADVDNDSAANIRIEFRDEMRRKAKTAGLFLK